jgi:hypothetical protein
MAPHGMISAIDVPYQDDGIAGSAERPRARLVALELDAAITVA